MCRWKVGMMLMVKIWMITGPHGTTRIDTHDSMWREKGAVELGVIRWRRIWRRCRRRPRGSRCYRGLARLLEEGLEVKLVRVPFSVNFAKNVFIVVISAIRKIY